MHPDLVGEILGRREGHPRGDEALHGRVVREVQEEDRPSEGTGPLEVVHEHPGLLMRDAHGGEHDSERFLAAEDLRLPRDLERDLVVRKTGAREQGELLATDERVQPVNRGDPCLDELGRMLPRIGVDRGSRDLDPFLWHDRRAAVDGFAGPAQDSAEHVAGHVQFDRLSEELHR